MSEEPLMDVAHLGHLELLTAKPEESLRLRAYPRLDAALKARGR